MFLISLKNIYLKQTHYTVICIAFYYSLEKYVTVKEEKKDKKKIYLNFSGTQLFFTVFYNVNLLTTGILLEINSQNYNYNDGL